MASAGEAVVRHVDEPPVVGGTLGSRILAPFRPLQESFPQVARYWSYPRHTAVGMSSSPPQAGYTGPNVARM